jgi:AcrR family transcriptional regulator
MRNAHYNSMRRYKPAAGSVPPLTRKGEATRKRILEAAISEIGNNGYHAASVSSITNQAGVGQGTFYLYFKSKDDLLTELVTKLTSELRSLLTLASESAASRLAAERNSLKAFWEYVHQNKALYQLFMECQFINPELHQKCYMEFASHWTQGLDQAAHQGEVIAGNNEIRAWAIMGMHHMLAMRFSLWNAEMPSDELVDEALVLLRDGMAARSANA